MLTIARPSHFLGYERFKYRLNAVPMSIVAGIGIWIYRVEMFDINLNNRIISLSTQATRVIENWSRFSRKQSIYADVTPILGDFFCTSFTVIRQLTVLFLSKTIIGGISWGHLGIYVMR